MPYQDRCVACQPLPPCTIMRDAGPADSCCGHCGARNRLLYVAGEREPEPAGPVLLPHEKQALSAWCFDHSDEVEARGLTATEAARCRYWRWLMQTERVTP